MFMAGMISQSLAHVGQSQAARVLDLILAVVIGARVEPGLRSNERALPSSLRISNRA